MLSIWRFWLYKTSYLLSYEGQAQVVDVHHSLSQLTCSDNTIAIYRSRGTFKRHTPYCHHMNVRLLPRRGYRTLIEILSCTPPGPLRREPAMYT